MADQDALAVLHKCAEAESGGAAEWNRYRADKGSIDLSRADLSHCALPDFNLARCELSAARLFNADLSGADLAKANLTYADMRRINLANGYLTGANLSACNLQGANLVDTNLDEANLAGALLAGAHLVGASLLEANLENANLRGATLKFANLAGARLTGADVEEADLTGVDLSDEDTRALVNYATAIVKSKALARSEGRTRRGLPAEENYDELFAEHDAHKILEISPGASLEQITRAYRLRAKEYHPDRVAHLGKKLQYVAQREFTRVQHAYKSLVAHAGDPMMTVRVRNGQTVVAKDARDLTVSDYIEMLKWQPNSDVLHYNLGVKYLEMGLAELAAKANEKALSLNPKNEHAQHNLRLAKLILALQE